MICALAGFLMMGFSAQGTHAQNDAVEAPGNLDVGLYVSPPFVEETGGDPYSGMAIDLWESIAQRMGSTFQYVRYPTVRDLVQATAAGEIDVAVTNLTITRDRAQTLAFTQPWYDAGLRIMVPDEGSGGFWGVLAGLKDAGHLRAYAWLLSIIIAATVGITVFDRRFDAEFPKRWREGVAESLYNVMSIVTSGKSSRKNLFGWIGRIGQAAWLVVGVGIIAYITSSVTSVMTTVSLTQDINSLSDLTGKTVAVRTGSVSEDYVRERGIASRSYPGIDDAVAALQARRVDAIVADAPILEHYAHKHAERGMTVVGGIFHPDKYGFGFPHGSDLARRVTLEILDLQEDGTLQGMKLKYFGHEGR